MFRFDLPREADVAALLRIVDEVSELPPHQVVRRTHMLAALASLTGDAATAHPRLDALPPRLRPVLRHLMQGDAAKDIAAKLKLSRHTVHRYTQSIYAHLGVHSRGELLAQHGRWYHGQSVALARPKTSRRRGLQRAGEDGAGVLLRIVPRLADRPRLERHLHLLLGR
jgi:DNA-binding CsgD family transcriptional regulator